MVYMVRQIGSGDLLRIAPPQFAPLSVMQLKQLVHEQCPDMPPDVQRLISAGEELGEMDVVTLAVAATPMEKNDAGAFLCCVAWRCGVLRWVGRLPR